MNEAAIGYYNAYAAEVVSGTKEAGFAVLELFITSDVRHERQNEKWINVIEKSID